MSTPRLVSLIAANGVAVVLIGWLGLTYDSRAFAVGIGLVCLGWILHDDAPVAPRRDSTS